MSTPHRDHERLTELLADRAVFGLNSDEERELGKLLIMRPDVDCEEFERLAAVAQLASLNEQDEMPADLKAKVAAEGRETIAKTGSVSLAPSDRAASRREIFAWLCAAASLLLAVFVASRREPQDVSQLTASELKTQLLQSNDKLTEVAWSPGSDDAGKNVEGDVVWDNKRQLGVMSFRGLPPNDPAEYQYQLWIFDTAQDEKYPVDGGVFDIPKGAEEAVVVIDPKLTIVEPTLFAVTIEKPGGVVVSSRERLALLAQVAP